jgi:hypothetical protein
MKIASGRLSFAISLLVHSATAFSQVAMAPTQPTSASTSGIGFASVALALDSLKERPGVSIATKPDGGVVISESRGMSTWIFTAASHYAHPAVVHLQLKMEPGGILSAQIDDLCEAGKSPCAKYLKEVKDMNAQMLEIAQKHLKSQTGRREAP